MARQAGVLTEVVFEEGLEGTISCGQAHVFPDAAIEKLAAALGRSIDCYIPLTECEAAAAEFARALSAEGWKFFHREDDPPC